MFRGLREVEYPGTELGAGLAHGVGAGCVPRGVYEVSFGYAEGGAVGEHLVEVGVGPIVVLHPLVFGVKDGGRSSVPFPDEIGADAELPHRVEMTGVLVAQPASIGFECAAERDGEPVFECLVEVEEESAGRGGAGRLIDASSGENDPSQSECRLVVACQPGRRGVGRRVSRRPAG